jgi:hypothetical protein
MNKIIEEINNKSQTLYTTEEDSVESISIKKAKSVLKENNIKPSEELLNDIESETEYLETAKGKEIECISVENFVGLLKRHNVILQ